VGAHTGSGSHDLDRCLAAANALVPDLMTAEERLTEVAQILAAGLIRRAAGDHVGPPAPRLW
jgi:hypothetical protein